MILIIGGAYQGKKEYTRQNFAGKEMVADFHLTILEFIKSGIDPVEYIQKNLDDYKGKVIICDDISCGVVPIDPLMRKWREAQGRTLAVIAQECDQVIRVFCGIGTNIK